MNPSQQYKRGSILAPGNVFLLFVAACLTCRVSLSANEQAISARSGPSTNDAIAFDAFDYSLGALHDADGGFGWKQAWRSSRAAAPSVVGKLSKTAQGSPMAAQRSLLIQGTGARNNPLRRELREPLSQPRVFVRFDLHYREEPSADSSKVDPEFVVLWLDRLDGGDRSTHASNIPNIGLHLADRGPKKGKNVFMVRVGPAKTAWSKIEVQPGRTYEIVGRLTKSAKGVRADYDRVDLWVDPSLADLTSPDATVSGVQSISRIQWIGF